MGARRPAIRCAFGSIPAICGVSAALWAAVHLYSPGAGAWPSRVQDVRCCQQPSLEILLEWPTNLLPQLLLTPERRPFLEPLMNSFAQLSFSVGDYSAVE